MVISLALALRLVIPGGPQFLPPGGDDHGARILCVVTEVLGLLGVFMGYMFLACSLDRTYSGGRPCCRVAWIPIYIDLIHIPMSAGAIFVSQGTLSFWEPAPLFPILHGKANRWVAVACVF